MFEVIAQETLTFSGAAAGFTAATMAGAARAEVEVLAGTLRLRVDGVDPTASTGLAFPTGSAFTVTGDLTNVKAIQQDAPAIIRVLYAAAATSPTVLTPQPALSRGPSALATSTIANGAAVGSAFRAEGSVLVACKLSAAWTAASLGFLWAPDAATEPAAGDFVEVYDAAGAPIGLVVVAGKGVEILKTCIIGNGWLKPWSHTAGADVNQGAARTLTFALG
jgi:hypothetical protein